MGTSVFANNGEFEADQRFFMGKNVIFNGFGQENGFVKTITCSDESSLSSIGKNSDVSEGLIDDDDDEVQSSFKSPLDDAMAELEDALPIKRGFSRFYSGKSKSFATLPDDSSFDIKDIAKKENAFTRRRRNELARQLILGKTRNSSHLSTNGGGISKRGTGSSKTTLALGVAMNDIDESEKLAEKESSPVIAIRKDMGCWRSFSFADFQHCVSDTNSNQAPTKLS